MDIEEELAAFKLALQGIQTSIAPLKGDAARLALIACLAMEIVFGADNEDEADTEAERLPLAIRDLGKLVLKAMTDQTGENENETTEKLDLLSEFLERRRKP